MKFLKKNLNKLLLAGLAYTPLEPLPGAPSGTYSSLSVYLNYMFKILLSIGAMIAVVTLVLGGVTYMVSESLGTKSDARRRIQASLIGLLLLLVSWLVLYTINPNLTTFNLPITSSAVGTQNSGVSNPILPASNPSNLSATDLQAIQDYYSSKGSNAKVAFAKAVDINDTDSINAVAKQCDELSSSVSPSQLVKACAAGGAAGGTVGAVGAWFSFGTSILGGALVGCGVSAYALNSANKPSIDVVPDDAQNQAGKIVMSCNY